MTTLKRCQERYDAMEDPAYWDDEPRCPKCGEEMIQDLFKEWYCLCEEEEEDGQD